MASLPPLIIVRIIMYKHALSINIEQNDSWKQATFKSFGRKL